ncbi:MAG: FAD-binding oxidoreductase [Alphaproteobacteria bacterium]|nr:FAD-binding oxidoreductase [Alphaproteobacteria bacterium]
MASAAPAGIPASVVERLQAAAGAGGWIADPERIAPYLIDQRKRYRGRTPLVLLPDTTAKVVAIVKACAETRTPLVPQGGNTGLVGGATPSERGDAVVVNLGRMNRIRALDTAAATVTAEAGCILASVQKAADDAGLLFPLSLGAEGSCQIGGNLATNAGGLQVLRYGSARALTLGLEVVLADGRVWDGLRGLYKDNTGYDLKQLFVGAEGTLGIITAAVLRLFPRPAQRVTALAAVADIDAALTILAAMRAASGDRMNACEIMSERALGFAVKHAAKGAAPFAANHPWTLLLEFEAGAGDELRGVIENALGGLIDAGHVRDAVVAANTAQAQTMWHLRESIPGAQGREGGSIKHDIAVPQARMAEFVRSAEAAVTRALPGLRVCAFGHLGDGNLHYNLSQPVGMDEALFLAEWDRLARIVHDLTVATGGSISAEHGIGQMKRDELVRVKPPVEIEMMRALKRALDPDGIMNPGKVL